MKANSKSMKANSKKKAPLGDPKIATPSIFKPRKHRDEH
jgi:hypothetical protein